jgi:predicted GIY-YIG superfamily endonuclease
MISQSKKAKEVRKYFIEMEKLVSKYYEIIKEEMYKKIGLLEINQKPKIKKREGIIYILRALNTSETLYKIGKTKDLEKRLKTYNSGNANNIEPVFILKVEDIDNVERCIKNACKKMQYRKYKEVYEIDLEILKEIIKKCEEISKAASIAFNKIKKKELKIKIENLKEVKNNHFIYIK